MLTGLDQWEGGFAVCICKPVRTAVKLASLQAAEKSLEMCRAGTGFWWLYSTDR